MSINGELSALYSEMNQTLGDKYFEMPKPDTIIYHYTTADALMGILESRTLRASNVLFMNDPLELRYSLNLATSTIDATRHHEKDPINEIYARYYKTYFITKLEPRAERQFVLSFSLNPDSLHLWNAYARNDGYAIGFRLSDFLGGLMSTNAEDTSTKIMRLLEAGTPSYHAYSLYFGKMLYSKQLQENLLSEAVSFLDRALSLISTIRPNRPPIEMQAEMSPFLQLFTTILYNMKHEPHQIEEEFRIVLIPDEVSKVAMYINRNGIITPYIALGKISEQISCLVVGPKMRDEAATKGLRSFLNSKGHDRVQIVQSAIRVR
jgi:hypothetical protein